MARSGRESVNVIGEQGQTYIARHTNVYIVDVNKKQKGSKDRALRYASCQVLYVRAHVVMHDRDGAI